MGQVVFCPWHTRFLLNAQSLPWIHFTESGRGPAIRKVRDGIEGKVAVGGTSRWAAQCRVMECSLTKNSSQHSQYEERNATVEECNAGEGRILGVGLCVCVHGVRLRWGEKVWSRWGGETCVVLQGNLFYFQKCTSMWSNRKLFVCQSICRCLCVLFIHFSLLSCAIASLQPHFILCLDPAIFPMPAYNSSFTNFL